MFFSRKKHEMKKTVFFTTLGPYVWNQENATNATIVVGYAYLVIIPRPEQADRMNSTSSNEPSNIYHGFSQNKDLRANALCLSTTDMMWFASYGKVLFGLIMYLSIY